MGNKLDFNTVSNHLGQYVTDHKKAFIEEVLSQRTRHATLVLEDIYQSQNASAVFRTAECFGIQDIHLIENVGNYTVNKRVLKGADKWLSIFKYNKEINNTRACFKELKSRGYKILATSPAAALTLEEIDVTSKIAIVLGNELHGLSDEARAQADFQVRIPMFGFTESLNLSVSAAICVNNIIPKMRKENIKWQLSDEEKDELRLAWYKKSIKNSDVIERKFLKSIQ